MSPNLRGYRAVTEQWQNQRTHGQLLLNVTMLAWSPSRNWPLAQHHALGAARAGDEGANRAAAAADKPHRSLPHSLLLLLPFDWNFPLREKSPVFPFSSLWAQRQWEKKSWNLGSSVWAMPPSSLSGNLRRSRTTKDLVVDAVQQAAHGEDTSGSRKLPPSTAVLPGLHAQTVNLLMPES